jgi:hypothetical protein
MKPIEFAKLADVSRMAISKAIRSGIVVLGKDGGIDPNNETNVYYINSNKSKRRNHKLAAKVSKLDRNKKEKRKSNSNKKSSNRDLESKSPTDQHGISGEEELDFLSKADLEKEKLAIEVKLKKVQFAITINELVPIKIFEARLAQYQIALQNSILILPEKIATDLCNIIIEKGIDGKAEAKSLLSKAIAHGVNESKRAIDKVTDFERTLP